MLKLLSKVVLAVCLLVAPAALHAAEPDAAVLKTIDRSVEEWRLDAHVPGLVYGVVKDGQLIAVRGLGVQDVVTQRAVTADSLFRIASMSKAFTALALSLIHI